MTKNTFPLQLSSLRPHSRLVLPVNEAHRIVSRLGRDATLQRLAGWNGFSSGFVQFFSCFFFFFLRFFVLFFCFKFFIGFFRVVYAVVILVVYFLRFLRVF